MSEVLAKLEKKGGGNGAFDLDNACIIGGYWYGSDYSDARITGGGFISTNGTYDNLYWLAGNGDTVSGAHFNVKFTTTRNTLLITATADCKLLVVDRSTQFLISTNHYGFTALKEISLSAGETYTDLVNSSTSAKGINSFIAIEI